MINVIEYAYQNYGGENEDSVVDGAVELLLEDLYDACDADERTDYEVSEQLEEAIRDFVLEAVNFNEIKRDAEDDRDEYYEAQKARRGEY